MKKTMRKMLSTALGLALAGAAFTADAKINGKNVVLVHGFQSYQIEDKPGDAALKSNADKYWKDYWLSRAEENIYWSSADRISGGVKDKVRAQFQSIANRGTCRNGCVFVTHSTGDLVLRYAMQKLGQWGLKNDIKIMTTLDFGAAGGGTEIADVAVAISEGKGWVNSIQKSAVKTFMGFTPRKGQMGVLYDLQPNNARRTAIFNNPVPRLRFVGTGSEYLGVTKPFISGKDDSVVPLHSACGASTKGAYDSCSKKVANNGVLKNISKAPNSLWYNHYAVLMGEKTNHSQTINNSRSGEFTTVSNNFTAGALRVDFATSTKKKWWSWGKKVRWIKDGSKNSMSKNVYNTLNN